MVITSLDTSSLDPNVTDDVGLWVSFSSPFGPSSVPIIDDAIHDKIFLFDIYHCSKWDKFFIDYIKIHTFS